MTAPHAFTSLNLFARCSLCVAIIAAAPWAAACGAEPRQNGQSPAGRPYGLQQRIAWTGSRVTGSPDAPPPFAIERVFPALRFQEPTVLTNLPGSGRLFVVEREGKIFSFPNRGDVQTADLALDMRQEIPGMKQAYGMTFHPRFAENGYCYITYVLDPDLPEGTRVSRFKMTRDDPPQIDAASEQVIITWLSGGHNGGCLKFGPDGCLYISTGDGGPAFPPDPLLAGQDVSNLLSGILRIDVDHPDKDRPYSIPRDNPFVDLAGARGEIWAYGMRNPWKMSFDFETGDLWVGDVGWELWEMVYRVRPGDNYGWSIMEGSQPVHRERTRGPTPITTPAAEHSHTESRSLTGGFVYRGARLPALFGAYIYGDYVTGKLWGLRHDGERTTEIKELLDSPLAVICFGLDNDNELYVVDYAGGIYRLVENSAVAANRDFPTRLSETGLFRSVADHTVADGVIAYSVAAEPWADFATAARFVAVPNLQQIGVHTENNAQKGVLRGNWKFPPDSVLMKTISLELERGNPASAKRLETQILHYNADDWRAYSYRWNDEQTDAVLAGDEAVDAALQIVDPQAPGGKTTQTYHFASRSECLLCHTTRGGSIYGFVPEQLDVEHDYGEVVDNQLRTLSHIGLFEQPAEQTAEALPNPHDSSADLQRRARAYLHVNCAHCHRRGGGGTAAIDIPHNISLPKTNLLDARPTQGVFGIHSAQVLAPGDPYRSVLYYRMAKLGRGRMPHFGSTIVDKQGLALIHDWIDALPPMSASELPDSVAKLRARQRAWLDQLRHAADGAASEQSAQSLLSSTSGALMLLRSIDDGELAPPIANQAIELAAAADDPQIRDLFERFLPEDQRTRRLGAVVNAADILNLPGDAARGAELFASAEGVQCKSCHKIGQVGQELGPNLDEIGKKLDRAQLLDSILQPSKTIDPKFVTYLVETTDGRVVSGLLLSRDQQQAVLRDAQNHEIRVAQADIEFIAPQQKSLMPELLLQDMTAQQVADLLAYLSQRK